MSAADTVILRNKVTATCCVASDPYSLLSSVGTPRNVCWVSAPVCVVLVAGLRWTPRCSLFWYSIAYHLVTYQCWGSYSLLWDALNSLLSIPSSLLSLGLVMVAISASVFLLLALCALEAKTQGPSSPSSSKLAKCCTAGRAS